HFRSYSYTFPYTSLFRSPPSQACWIYESHANWMPHQLERFLNEVHYSEMLVNAPHLYYGSTRDRYCNWQFFEFLKNKYCYDAVRSEEHTSELQSRENLVC